MSTVDRTPISVVLVGFGLGGRVFHAPLICAVPGLRLDAIVTRDPARQAQVRASYPDATVYSSAEEAWAGRHSLAVISTANVTHAPYATAALESGLNVVLDKPIAPTAKVAQDLADLAGRSHRLLIPFQNRRWDSDFLTAQTVAADGRIGALHRFESRIERMRVVPKTGWRLSTDPADMGGMLYDLGAHLVDQALRLMGPVRSVTASVRAVRGASGSDDDVTLLLVHESGSISHIVASQIGAFGAPRMSLFGTRGGLRIDASDSQETGLASGRSPADPDWGLEPRSADAVLRVYDDTSTLTESALALEPGNWPAFYPGVAAALRGDQEPPVLLADVIANLRVLDAARESAATSSTVRLDPPAGHLASSTS